MQHRNEFWMQPPELEDEEGISYSLEMKDFIKQAYVNIRSEPSKYLLTCYTDLRATQICDQHPGKCYNMNG